jgi:hypothetical protein
VQKYKTQQERVEFYKGFLAPHPVITASDVYIDISNPYYPVVTGIFTAVVYVPGKKPYSPPTKVVSKAKFYIKYGKFGYTWKIVKQVDTTIPAPPVHKPEYKPKHEYKPKYKPEHEHEHEHEHKKKP